MFVTSLYLVYAWNERNKRFLTFDSKTFVFFTVKEINILFQSLTKKLICVFFSIHMYPILNAVCWFSFQTRFNGLCILYGDFTSGRTVIGSSDSNCNYPIYFGIFGMILFALLAGLCFGYFTLKSRSDSDVK